MENTNFHIILIYQGYFLYKKDKQQPCQFSLGNSPTKILQWCGLRIIFAVWCDKNRRVTAPRANNKCCEFTWASLSLFFSFCQQQSGGRLPDPAATAAAFLRLARATRRDHHITSHDNNKTQSKSSLDVVAECTCVFLHTFPARPSALWPPAPILNFHCWRRFFLFTRGAMRFGIMGKWRLALAHLDGALIKLRLLTFCTSEWLNAREMRRDLHYILRTLAKISHTSLDVSASADMHPLPSTLFSKDYATSNSK